MRIRHAIFSLTFLLLPLGVAAAQGQSALTVTWAPEKPVNGAAVMFQVVSSAPLQSLSGSWLGRRLYFDFDQSKGTWYGLAGVKLETPAGRYLLRLEAIGQDGRRFTASRPVPIGRAAYRTVKLSVPRRYTEPDAPTLERIKQEQALKKEAFGHLSPERFWSRGFAAPLDEAIVTEEYGVQRRFNRRRQSVHLGIDLRAPLGTPVKAINHAEVLLAREMFFEGGFVILDHGQGLLSLYLHLSEIKVRPGEFVKRGQIIGLSGDSGRVTAPHLHMGIRWQGVYLDGATLLKQ